MLFFRNNWDDYPQSLEKNVRLKPGNGRNVQPQMSHLRQSVDIVRKAFWISWWFTLLIFIAYYFISRQLRIPTFLSLSLSICIYIYIYIRYIYIYVYIYTHIEIYLEIVSALETEICYRVWLAEGNYSRWLQISLCSIPWLCCANKPTNVGIWNIHQNVRCRKSSQSQHTDTCDIWQCVKTLYPWWTSK